MPRISTDNYDTVASWNGSQDLFVVEQPDGTKVATPALLKQYVLDGVTETSEQYAESSTARNVTAKTVTLPGFKLEAGARISVRFTNTGTSNPASGNLTLNVNGTGAKEIVDSHTNKTKLTYTSGGLFFNNSVLDFIYDGTYWVYMNRDNNTTYTSKAAASGGTATSLCTTGEKYTWNNKQDALTVETYTGNLNFSGKYTAHKYGRVVSLKIYNVVNPNTSQQMVLTESFPTAIRPMVDVNVVGMYGEGGFNASAASVNYRIEANGKIWTYAYQAFTSGTASITYMSAT